MLEILAPSGNLECADVAIRSGANAIYLGYTAFSARDGADNFDEQALAATLQKAHLAGVKVYVAMNTVVKSCELDSFLTTLLSLWGLGVDAIILQDILLGKYIHSLYPQIVLHLSTQAGVCTSFGALLAKEYGFSRVILARETPLEEIKKITSIIETEVFVQGALCTCFSGQCYFSSYVGGNSGNRGRCKQPCRKQYSYDRNGFEEKAYALSLSDLSVGEDIQRLIDAGVVSFKIEGRMRRKEYVGAAVRYYRAILDGTEAAQMRSDLMRTYNRGNYTKGLAFGQDKRFLSRSVQGHIGEKVGIVKVEKGRFLVESSFKATQGDSFKILRNGKEVGGATFGGSYSRGFILFSRVRLMNGDGVFVTTDSQANARAVSGEAPLTPISLKLHFAVGERAYAEGGGVSLSSDFLVEKAASRPLSRGELCENFAKTDGLPIAVSFESVELNGEIFIPKSQLNAFRRAFYEKWLENVCRGQRECLAPAWSIPSIGGKQEKTAVISTDFTGVSCDVAIYKPSAYTQELPASFLALKAEKYLYLPPFHTQSDVNQIALLVKEYGLDGIYSENYDGISIAREYGFKLFAGTGFNLTNKIAVNELMEYATYYAISKELSEKEIDGLISEKAFAFSSGDLKIMDLCYCPFGKTCNRCDKRDTYTLTDENGRRFPVRRYLSGSGECRFEVYNCASQIGTGYKGAGRLLDVTITTDKPSAVAAAGQENQQKQVYASYTSGHTKNGVL